MILRNGLEGPEALFIKRAERAGDPWSGHIAFPGGKRESRDPSVLQTALRETEEEVGLRIAPASLVARLQDVTARRNGYRVAHFIVQLDDPAARIVMGVEVAAALWVPFGRLAASAEGPAAGVSPVEFAAASAGEPFVRASGEPAGAAAGASAAAFAAGPMMASSNGTADRSPYVRLGDYLLWGMTYRMVLNALEAIGTDAGSRCTEP
jgi:8-oxo-dGTP pyrophosphatase MutT (NUDIX family)